MTRCVGWKRPSITARTLALAAERGLRPRQR
jgi:hypothetical protein